MLRLRVGSRTFAPGLAATLAMLPLLALLVALGTWQLHRASEKRALADAFARAGEVHALPDAGRATRYERVAAEGHYVPSRQFLLDNMTHEGAAGYRVLTPLERPDGRWLLVDRGWLPAGADRRRLPPVEVGDGPRTVVGRLDSLPVAGLKLAATSEDGWPRRVSFPSLPELERVLARPLYPQVLLLDPAAPDGFVRAWAPGGLPPERHLGYAVQWYALAAALVVLYCVASLKRPEAS